jgi:hypothetical protein
MGFIGLGIKGKDVDIRDAPGMQGRIVGQVSDHQFTGNVILKAPGDRYGRFTAGLVAIADPIRDGKGNPAWYRLFSFSPIHYGIDGSGISVERFDTDEVFRGSMLYIHADFAEPRPLSFEKKHIQEYSKGR